MRYALLDIELGAGLPTALPADCSGAGVLVRSNGWPSAFGMAARRSGESDADLVRRIVVREADRLAEALLRPQLTPGSAPARRTLTVAICTKDRPDLLARCLDRLCRIRPEWARLLVVDNAPGSNATHEAVSRMPGVDYVVEPVAGLDIARNRALAQTRTDWLAFIDDDAVADERYFDGISVAWAEHPDAAALTGLVLPFELASEAQILFESEGGFGRGFTQRRFGSELAGNPVYPCGSGIFGAGCNMAFDTAFLRGIGGFDIALDTGRPLPGGGDLDIFYRTVRSGGVLVYEPRMAVFHQHRADLAGLTRQYWSWGLGLMAFVSKSRDADPAMRARFDALLKWWFLHQGKMLAKAAAGRGYRPFAMVFAELRGAVQGLLGEYGRSRRRISAAFGRPEQ